MKGVVFNILEAFVVENFGEDAYDDILDLCPAAGEVSFVGPKTYDDGLMLEIVGAACKHLDVPAEAALRSFGRFAFPHLAKSFPVFVDNQTDALAFLETVDEIIHVEVAKLMEGSVLPGMQFRRREDDTLVIEYDSARKMCHLLEGLLDGVGDWFETPLTYRQTSCTHHGAERCTIEVRREADGAFAAA